MVTTFKGLANKWVILALLLASIGAVLAVTLMPAGAQVATIKFPENSTGPVGDFTAVDPEGRSLAKWAVVTSTTDSSGTAIPDIEAADITDSGLFSISSAGVLTFDKAPDYEDDGRTGTTAAERNTYRLVISATDSLRTSYEKVVVNVTNEDEPAATGIELSLVQPREGQPVTVMFTDGVGNPFVDTAGASNTPSPVATGTAASGIKDPDGDKDLDAVSDAASDPSFTEISADDVGWQWARGSSRTGTFTDITEAQNGTRDQISYMTIDADRGRYLRVTATYRDGEGKDKTLEATSLFPVAPLRADTVAPTFPTDFDSTDQNPSTPPTAKVADGVEEGTRVGTAVSGRSESGENLTYSLEHLAAGVTGSDSHADLFQINRATGQVSVGIGKTVNPFEDGNDNVSGPKPADATNTFTFTIKIVDGAPAHDPGDGSSVAHEATVNMTVTVDPKVDEDPVFEEGKTSYMHKENTPIATAVDTFAAYDPEDVAVTLTLSGPDKDRFTLPTAVENADSPPTDTWDSDLSFAAVPDFEDPKDDDKDNVYEITVTASSGAGADEKTKAINVTVTVTNEDEPGDASLSARQPRIGVPISAMVDSDSDGPVTGVTWQWQLATTDSTSTTAPCDPEDTSITFGEYEDAEGDGASTGTYTPTRDDSGKCLRATADYTDPAGSGGANVVSELTVQSARNLAPRFRDEDNISDGLQIKPRYVVENAAADAPVVINSNGTTAVASVPNAEDDPVDALDNLDADTSDDDMISYSLSGADAGAFSISSATATAGQISVKSGAKLNYEAQRVYMVTVTATDLEGLRSSVMVVINVVDVNEGPEIKEGRLAVSGPPLVPYTSMGTGDVGTYTAVGADAEGATWSLAGDDAGVFRISSGGVLTFATPPDTANPADDNMDKHL